MTNPFLLYLITPFLTVVLASAGSLALAQAGEDIDSDASEITMDSGGVESGATDDNELADEVIE